jgi:hypothetical protein
MFSLFPAEHPFHGPPTQALLNELASRHSGRRWSCLKHPKQDGTLTHAL